MGLVDILFPPYCCHCQKVGSLLCGDCYERIYFFSLPVTVHLEESYLDSVIAATEYGDVSKDLIKCLKYSGTKDAAITCAQLLYYSLSLPKVDCVTAVPLHPKKQKLRGFNQAELISIELARLLNTHYVPLLTKITHTKSQASTANKESRVSNLSRAFMLMPSGVDVTNKKILLLDDVITTGTTLNECAQVLKSNGAMKVFGVAVAHGH